MRTALKPHGFILYGFIHITLFSSLLSGEPLPSPLSLRGRCKRYFPPECTVQKTEMCRTRLEPCVDLLLLYLNSQRESGIGETPHRRMDGEYNLPLRPCGTMLATRVALSAAVSERRVRRRTARRLALATRYSLLTASPSSQARRSHFGCV